MERSQQWNKGKFHNPQPLWTDYARTLVSILKPNPFQTPKETVPTVSPTREQLESEPSSGLHATWLGHSTVLLDIDGTKILTDPVWGDRASPVSWAGPRRFQTAPVPFENLPVPQIVVISHNHYDHLDRSAILRMKNWNTRFVVPLGVGAYLKRWGIPEYRITELDWWEKILLGSLEITCTPARHASGRGLFDKDKTLWAGYAFRSARHRVYFSGDTGLFPGLADIGARLGPFDLTLIETGAYDQAWPDWHLGPEQAVEAHALVQGRVMLPIHWGTFKLGAHGWTEPVERVLAAARLAGIAVVVPRPGEGIEAGSFPARWWPVLPWKNAKEVPILATKNGLKPLPQN